jgi:hypothetical protein
LDANQAVSFFACIMGNHTPANANIHSISLANDKTQEKLVIKAIDPNLGYLVMISRYPMGATEEWIEEMGNFIHDVGYIVCQERTIRVDLNINSE